MNEKETKKFIELYNLGFSAGYIAKKLGWKFNTNRPDYPYIIVGLANLRVKNHAKALGLKRPETGYRFRGIDTQHKIAQNQIRAVKGKIQNSKQRLVSIGEKQITITKKLVLLNIELDILQKKKKELELKISIASNEKEKK